MNTVESFAVDHTIMEAPNCRLASVKTGPQGDIVSKFDLRFVKPNTDAITTAGMHTLEHCLATYIRAYFDDVIDLSPMGCRTGFYLIVFGQPDTVKVRSAVLQALECILHITADEVPGIEEVSCGNYKDHSFSEARYFADKIIREWKS